jgi:hypothetical protein
MSNAVVGQSLYPTFQTIADGVRLLVNDPQGGIISDSPTVFPSFLPALNMSMRELRRKVGLVGAATLIKDNYILLGCPVVNGVAGQGVTNAATQCAITPIGFYDGSEYWPDFPLPPDFYMLLDMWERQTNSNLPFTRMHQAQSGLSCTYQTALNRQCEWRNDSIWIPGTTSSCDFRIRYEFLLPAVFGPEIDFNTTQIPILDCEEFMIYATALKIGGVMLGAEQFQLLEGLAADAISDLKNAYVQRDQEIDYSREPYGVEGHDGHMGRL